MTVALLMAGTIVTFRPSAANNPSCLAMYTPAESAAGTAATVRLCSSTPDYPDPFVLEHPAASEAVTTTAMESAKNLRFMICSPQQLLFSRTSRQLSFTNTATCEHARGQKLPSCPALTCLDAGPAYAPAGRSCATPPVSGSRYPVRRTACAR